MNWRFRRSNPSVMRRLRITTLAALAGISLLLVSSSASAQLSSASVNGTVRDTSGAVIDGAQLTLRNTSTGVERRTATNSTGNYAFIDIAPATYTLQVAKTGFATAQQNAVVLSVNQTAKFDFILTVGSEVQQVTVTSAEAELETMTSNLGTVFNSVSVNDLPLNGRDFEQLLTLMPGSSRINKSQGIGPAVNGQPNRSNLYLLDGISDEQILFSKYVVRPIVDDIQEFKVQSHNDQSQFGGVLGGIVNVVTKSGTDQYHGDVWEFLRNDALDARNPFLPKKTPLKQSVYGATIGGPVILPYYNGRQHHTFFFGAFEGTSIHTAGQALYNVPTAAELAGDFSAVPQQIYNPFSTTPDPKHPGKYLRTPFPNNQIRQALLDPHMVKLAEELFPKPVATTNGFNGINTQPTQTMENNYSLRLDHQVNQSNLLWARLSQFHGTTSSSGDFKDEAVNSINDGQNWAVSYVHTFGSSATLELEAGHVWNYGEILHVLKNAAPNLISDTGYKNDFGCKHIGPLPCMIPNISIPGYLGGGEEYSAGIHSELYEYKADFTKLLGNHMIGFGANIASLAENNLGSNSGVGFSAFQTSNLENSKNTGNTLASFLLGVPTSGSRTSEIKNVVGGRSNGFYAEDQWRVTPKLTMNWGLRYDMVVQPELGASPTGSNFTGHFDLRNGTYVLTKSTGKLGSCATLGAAPCIPGGTLPAHVVVANSNRQINSWYDNIQPRVGIAYQINPKRVLHVSYGRVFDSWSDIVQAAQGEGAVWPSVGKVSAVNLNSTIPDPNATAENPLGNQASLLPPSTPFNQGTYFTSPHLKNPYSDQWLAGLQQQVGSNTVWTLNYVGSVTRRLPCCGFYNVALTPGPGSPQARAPYTYIKPMRYQRSNGSSSYNALQVQLKRQLTSGLAYMLNYTWSKTIDVACDGFTGAGNCFVRNPYDPKADRSVAGFDLPNMFTGTVMYRLPFGTGRKFQTGHRATDAIIGGWQLNAIASLTSGQPFTVSYSGDKANTGNNNQGVDLVGNPNFSHRTPAEWFNTAAFQAPAPYTYGNVPRNTLRSDWYKNLDLSLFRTFPIKRVRAEFRAEAFNAINTVVYAVPGATLNAKTFGQVGGTANHARELQLALKIYF